MDRVYLKPAPGKTVRKPVGGHLAAEGDQVTLDSYWRRRLADGDVVEFKPAKALIAPKVDEPKAK